MAQLGRKSLLKTNMELWLNDKLLRQGLYVNVGLNEVDAYGNNISVLLPIEDEDFQTGQVWQSAFKNWVWESGIPSSVSGLAPPGVASGVVVNGSFTPEATTTGTFAHFIDYPNGRVIFTAPISTATSVKSNFSYRTVTIEDADRFNNENQELLLETFYKDNPAQTGVANYPTKDQKTLPAIWIDIRDRNSSGYELGSRSIVSDFIGVLHVWARDTFLIDLLEDILGDEHRAVILGINFNNAPYHLLSRGRKNHAWLSYDTYANVHHPYFYRRIYLDNVNTRKDSKLFEIERSRVNFTARIYPNF